MTGVAMLQAAIGGFWWRRVGLAVAAALTALSIAGGPALAAPKDAENFVRDRVTEAISVLSKPGLSDQLFLREFNSFIDKSFDVPAMAQFALGVHWRAATPEQREEYVKLFKGYFVGTYAPRFRQYTGEQFTILGTRLVNATETLVQTRIVRPNNAQPINIEWHVREQGSDAKVVDLIIEGLRLGVTLRAEFSGVIKSGGGLDALFKALRDKNLTLNFGGAA